MDKKLKWVYLLLAGNFLSMMLCILIMQFTTMKDLPTIPAETLTTFDKGIIIFTGSNMLVCYLSSIWIIVISIINAYMRHAQHKKEKQQ